MDAGHLGLVMTAVLGVMLVGGFLIVVTRKSEETQQDWSPFAKAYDAQEGVFTLIYEGRTSKRARDTSVIMGEDLNVTVWDAEGTFERASVSDTIEPGEIIKFELPEGTRRVEVQYKGRRVDSLRVPPEGAAE